MCSGVPRPRPTAVYLEANAIGHLVPAEDTALARDRRARLDEQVRGRRLEVVASPILLEELAKIGKTNWPAHLRVLGYLRSISSTRLLPFLKDLTRRELRARHALKRSEARLGRTASDDLWRVVMDPAEVPGIAAQMESEADGFLADERRMRAEAMRELREHTPPDEAVEPNVWKSWSEGPTEHIRSFAEKTARANGVEAEPGELERLPALWRFHAYKVARIALMHARREGGGLQRTDAADAHHYALAGYADVFVSDDGPLRLTAEAIPRLRRPITLDDFARQYLEES